MARKQTRMVTIEGDDAYVNRLKDLARAQDIPLQQLLRELIDSGLAVQEEPEPAAPPAPVATPKPVTRPFQSAAKPSAAPKPGSKFTPRYGPPLPSTTKKEDEPQYEDEA